MSSATLFFFILLFDLLTVDNYAAPYMPRNQRHLTLALLVLFLSERLKTPYLR